MSTLHAIRSATHARVSMSAAQAAWDRLSPPDDNSLAEAAELESIGGEIITELQDPGKLYDFSERLEQADWVELFRVLANVITAGPSHKEHATVMGVLGPYIDKAAEERMNEAQDHD